MREGKVEGEERVGNSPRVVFVRFHPFSTESILQGSGLLLCRWKILRILFCYLAKIIYQEVIDSILCFYQYPSKMLNS